MRWTNTLLLALAVAPLGGCGGGTAAPGTAIAAPQAVSAPSPEPEEPPRDNAPVLSLALNDAILAAVRDYARDGSHPYAWTNGVDTDGVTRELYWHGTLLAAPQADGGIHCSGITYEVYLRALAAVVGDSGGPDAETLLGLKTAWYVRDGGELEPVAALADAGLGLRLDGLAALKPGDIVQFWRNSGKGHSVIFMDHTRNGDGSLRGMIYWSAQGTSGGIGLRRVALGADEYQIDPSRLYAVRPVWPGNWTAHTTGG